MASDDTQASENELSKLEFAQLVQLKEELDRDIEVLCTELQHLKAAQLKYQDSGECVQELNPGMERRPILLPMTNNMYVAGFLSETDKVAVGIGGDYYVWQETLHGKNNFKRKVQYVVDQMHVIQRTVQDKILFKDGTWNVRMLHRDYSLDVLTQKFQRHNLYIVDFQETRRTGKAVVKAAEDKLREKVEAHKEDVQTKLL